MADTFKIIGLQEAYNMMDDLCAKDKQRIILGILKKAANKLVKSKLESSNKYYPSKSRKGKPFTTTNDKNNPLGIISGVSGKFYHYRFIEFGTRPRLTKPFKTKTSFQGSKKMKVKIKKSVLNRGVMTAKPFMVKIIENSIKPVIDWFAENYANETKKRLDRLAKKK